MNGYDNLENLELEKVLQEVQLSFQWNEKIRVWQLEKVSADRIAWQSVMYPAPNLEEAERAALAHIRDYYDYFSLPGYSY